MSIPVQAQQQAQTTTRAGQTTQRPDQTDRSAVGQNAPPSPQEFRAQIRETIRAAQEAEADARNAQQDANQVRIQNGFPVVPVMPRVPQIEVRTGGAPNAIPPQVVDISIAFFVMCVVMIIGWPLARAWGKRLERGVQPTGVTPAIADQLQRIEQAVDAMSIEVERISESQRFLAKLQSGAITEPAALESGQRR